MGSEAHLAAAPAPGRSSLPRAHQFRHTYASLLIAAGAHPKYIQAQLGHASVQITMDVYGHLFPGTFARLADALDAQPTATLAQPPTR